NYSKTRLALHFASCNGGSKMSRPRQRAEPRAVVPLWAQRIAVKWQGDSLLIKGWGRVDGVEAVNPKDTSTSDLLQRFKRDAIRALRRGTKSKDAGVYRFANADCDEKL